MHHQEQICSTTSQPSSPSKPYPLLSCPTLWQLWRHVQNAIHAPVDNTYIMSAWSSSCHDCAWFEAPAEHFNASMPTSFWWSSEAVTMGIVEGKTPVHVPRNGNETVYCGQSCNTVRPKKFPHPVAGLEPSWNCNHYTICAGFSNYLRTPEKSVHPRGILPKCDVLLSWHNACPHMHENSNGKSMFYVLTNLPHETTPGMNRERLGRHGLLNYVVD